MELANASTYDDFEPYCKWERHEAEDVLIVHLPDFKRSELKIQINKFGVLTVFGESQPPKGVSRISRFTKRIRISNDYYDEDQIHAKFVSGILYINMPHRVLGSKTRDDRMDHTENLKHKTKRSISNSDGINNMPPLEDVDNVRRPDKKQDRHVKKSVVDTLDALFKEMSHGFGGLIADGEKGRRVALVASVVAVSSLGAYAAYKLWSRSQKT